MNKTRINQNRIRLVLVDMTIDYVAFTLEVKNTRIILMRLMKYINIKYYTRIRLW